MRLSDNGAALTVHYGETELLRYVYRPTDPPRESPRPYLHPLRTLGGRVVTSYRPEDHVWHKGLALSLPHVGSQNLWGGVTWVRGQGYRQLENNGSMRHVAFDEAAADERHADVTQRLEWLTCSGEVFFPELRRLKVEVRPAANAWVLGFAIRFVNVSGAPVAIGSPTTNGRPHAGYGGLFWRGPSSFTGGPVSSVDGAGGDERMGIHAPWLAIADGASTVLMVDAPDNPGHPTRWFVRSTPFACLCPAPFFDTEALIALNGAMALRYAVVIADGPAPQLTPLAKLAQETLRAWR